MRLGVVSPNVLHNIADWNAAYENPNQPWPFDSFAKRASLLFDKLYLTDNLELTREIVGSGEDDGPNCQTLHYLENKGLLLRPQDIGFGSGAALVAESTNGPVAELHRQLLRIGNPSNNCEPGECTYVGQPDIGDFEAHDGNHPRSKKGWDDPNIEVLKRRYESLLISRNVAMLRQAGVRDVAIVGRACGVDGNGDQHPVWEVVIREMPAFDERAAWEDVFGFRAEARTQHLVRSLRCWLRRVVSEEWTPSELEDEIRELVYQYEVHLRATGLMGGKGLLTCVITGAANVTENVAKLRITRLADLVTAVINCSAHLEKAELAAPGHELALFSELKKPI